MTHTFTVSYPRGTWSVYTCTTCHRSFCPTSAELQNENPPAFWNSACVTPQPLTGDDMAWLTGTGRFFAMSADNLSTEARTPPVRVKISRGADLNAAVAEHCMGVAKPTEPMSRFSSISMHFSCSWWWRQGWEPRPFATDPAANYALEQEVRKQGYRWIIVGNYGPGPGDLVSVHEHGSARKLGHAQHASRFIAMCLAALAAVGVEVDLEAGWEER